jgi:hypothetical protein
MRDSSKAAASITPALTESYGFAPAITARLIGLENLNAATAADHVEARAAFVAV